MSDDERALLSAVEANPADDLPRLVYADWLDERGFGVRAEFVRLQCEIAKKETLPRAIQNRYVGLWKRQQELLDHHLPELLGPSREALVAFDVRLERGFPVGFTLDVADFIDHGPALASLRPRPRVEVSNVGSRFHEFCRLPGDVSGCVTRIDVQSPRTAYPYALTVAEVAALVRAGAWGRLTGLHLKQCQIGDYGVTEVAANPAAFPALTELDLSHNEVTDAGVITLLNSGLLRRLTQLLLGTNPIGDQAALELADRLGPDNRLEWLELRLTNITRVGQVPLFHRFGGKVDLL